MVFDNRKIQYKIIMTFYIFKVLKYVYFQSYIKFLKWSLGVITVMEKVKVPYGNRWSKLRFNIKKEWKKNPMSVATMKR